MRRSVLLEKENLQSDSRTDMQVSPLHCFLPFVRAFETRENCRVKRKKHPRNIKYSHENKDAILDIF